MYINEYSCGMPAMQTQWGLLATAEHNAITSPTHGRLLQTAKTLGPESLRLSAG